jgi:hypothetical protein
MGALLQFARKCRFRKSIITQIAAHVKKKGKPHLQLPKMGYVGAIQESPV